MSKGRDKTQARESQAQLLKTVLVSAIMPTRGRRVMSVTALECWKSQDWPHKELLILDDADDPSFPSPPLDPAMAWPGHAPVRYFREPKRTIGAKREWLCAQATGEVIIHFDSDDWSAPGRITEQVELLLSSGKPMSGYHSLLFWDMKSSIGYQWTGAQGFAIGTSMCYTKEFWRRHHWPEYAGLPHHPRLEATDVEVVRTAQRHGGIATLEGRGMCIARAHHSNTSTARKVGQPKGPVWPRMQDSAFPDAFFAALHMEVLKAA
jgi:hypothetical protein